MMQIVYSFVGTFSAILTFVGIMTIMDKIKIAKFRKEQDAKYNKSKTSKSKL